MEFLEPLGAFSFDDLKELARRRGVALTPATERNRTTLVRVLAQSLDRFDGAYQTITHLSRAELSVLMTVAHSRGKTGVTAIARNAKVDAAAIRPVLDSLRLYGMLFPQGDWDHITVPRNTRNATNQLHHFGELKLAEDLQRPLPEAAPKAKVELRPGSFWRDLTELLARVARTRMKLTQAGRMNRRDLKAMEASFSIQEPGYALFVSFLAGSLKLLGTDGTGNLIVPNNIDDCLGLPPIARYGLTLTAWQQMRAYPESSVGDPSEEEYVPTLTLDQRASFVAALAWQEGTPPVVVKSLARCLEWMLPLGFDRWNRSSEPSERAAWRMARSLYWLGAAAVDNPERPAHVAMSPDLGRMLGRGNVAEAVPDDPQFFLQPNAEAFAPPNLAPRTYFHLRRISGEKKGGAEGMYPLTNDSLRRALDAGLTVAQIVTFLERFSRAGLPDNVRALVETVGRQHGRIRLVPTGFVLVTDTPQLLEELNHLKPLEGFLGTPLSDRVTPVASEQVAELLKRLRARGYAPLNAADVSPQPPLPDDPTAVPTETEAGVLPLERLGALEAVLDPELEEELDPHTLFGSITLPPGLRRTVTEPKEMDTVLKLAMAGEYEVEATFIGAGGQPRTENVGVDSARSRTFTLVVLASDETLQVKLDAFRSVRLTGEQVDWY
jgi:hypothetical protein